MVRVAERYRAAARFLHDLDHVDKALIGPACGTHGAAADKDLENRILHEAGRNADAAEHIAALIHMPESPGWLQRPSQ